MDTEQLQQLIRQELPRLLRQDPDFRAYVLSISQQSFADKMETEDKFNVLLNELRRDREENNRKWEAQEEHWKIQDKKWEEQYLKWENYTQDNYKLWQEMVSLGERIDRAIVQIERRHERSIGALGARWNTSIEDDFHNTLIACLKDNFGVSVLSVNEYDDEGEVFGRPDQVELDIIRHYRKIFSSNYNSIN